MSHSAGIVGGAGGVLARGAVIARLTGPSRGVQALCFTILALSAGRTLIRTVQPGVWTKSTLKDRLV